MPRGFSMPIAAAGSFGSFAAAAADGRGSSVPIMEAVLTMPEMLDPTSSPRTRINRIHNQGLREGLKTALRKHRRTHLPDHFSRFRQSKYQFKDRKEATIKRKQRGGRDTADLVKSGETKRVMTGRGMMKFRFTRKMPGTIGCAGIIKLPRAIGDLSGSRQQVTAEDVVAEIETWTNYEEQEAAGWFADHYASHIDRNLTKRARRKVMGSRLAAGLTANPMGVSL